MDPPSDTRYALSEEKLYRVCKDGQRRDLIRCAAASPQPGPAAAEAVRELGLVGEGLQRLPRTHVPGTGACGDLAGDPRGRERGAAPPAVAVELAQRLRATLGRVAGDDLALEVGADEVL